MHLEDGEVDLLKRWIVANVEARSDADSDVLAEYVVALVTSDFNPQPISKDHYVENLQDFLAANTQPFVDDLFRTLHTKSFDPSTPLSKPLFQHSGRVSVEQPRLPNEFRKRSFQDLDGDAETREHARSRRISHRPTKYVRSNGQTDLDRGWAGRLQPFLHQHSAQQQRLLPPLPTPPPGMPRMDAEGAMNAFLAMQQAMGLLPGMLNGTALSNGHPARSSRTRRCRDYETMGFCAAGISCPYEHGSDPYIIPASDFDYDPNHPALADLTPTRVAHIDNRGHAGGRSGNRGMPQRRGNASFRGGGRCASFSQKSLNRDLSVTTIMVEQIPMDRCDEQSVRGFFSDFGAIEEITIRPERSLAIVKFQTNKAARAAYESPKVIFDNRFVKVFWHKPEKATWPPGSQYETTHETVNGESFILEDSSDDEIEDIAKRQEAAQRKHEETKQRLQEIETQRRDTDAKLKAVETERREIADSIAIKTGKAFLPLLEPSENDRPKDNEQTRALKEQLAKLEAEAKSLGIDPDVAATNGYYSSWAYGGRGGYRGRGRGRGASYRNGWASRGSSVMRLDNRPKTVAITFADGDYDSRIEALRQCLLRNSLVAASIEKYPARDDTALVAFQHRFEGEILMQCLTHSSDDIGHVELAWFMPGTTIQNEVDSDGHNASMQDLQTFVGAADSNASDEAEEEDLDRWS